MAHSQHSAPNPTPVSVVVRYVTDSLDVLKRTVDLTSRELGQADAWGAFRVVGDQAIGSARHLTMRVGEAAERGDAWAILRTFADSGIEGLRDTLRTMAEEQARIDLVSLQARLVDGLLDSLRRQALGTIDACEGLVGCVGASAEGRLGAVTRVEIEPEPAGRAGGTPIASH